MLTLIAHWGRALLMLRVNRQNASMLFTPLDSAPSMLYHNRGKAPVSVMMEKGHHGNLKSRFLKGHQKIVDFSGAIESPPKYEARRK